MEVDNFSFPSLLPSMLEAIADSHFVSFDLEISGIQTRQINRNISRNDGSGGKQTLQQRYEEVKEAAERYQVLQIGITCVKEDKDQDRYIVRPYNFYINPVVEGRLEIERIFSYQSGAVEFLLSHGFRMEAPFTKGVPYLSREEEALARRIALMKLDKASVSDIMVKADDIESLAFIERVQSEINMWLDEKPKLRNFINITPEGYALSTYGDRGLNGYQKRLVHQLVRADYPDYVTISRPGFIQIVPYDQKREDAVKENRINIFEDKVARQIGLRWLVEAMVGGDLNAVDTKSFARLPSGQPVYTDLDLDNRDFDALRQRLAGKRTILVGHNLFLDLINFYTCFFGKLPDRVEDFQSIIHQLFPMVIDTKYMATQKSNDPNVKSSLEELDEELRYKMVPTIVSHSEHSKYDYTKNAHEAGYDSFLTAKVLIRLSAKLEAAGYYVDEYSANTASEDEAFNPAFDGVPVLDDVVNQLERKNNVQAEPRISHCKNGFSACKTQSQNSLPCEVSPEDRSWSEFLSSDKKRKQGAQNGPVKIKFSHPGRFDLLSELFSDDEQITDAAETTTATINGALRHEMSEPSQLNRALDRKPVLVQVQQQTYAMMPSFDSDFWRIYANKLRVNGTVEGVCDLWNI